MAQVIVCCAQKGGCAKTVTVHNLSTALSQMGKKILAVDFDAQASLTICFGIEPRTPSVNIAHLMDMQAQDLPTPTKEDFVLHCSGIDLIPSSSRLSAISEMLRHEIGCERFLSNILNTLRNDYDYIIVDTGPKLDNLSVNALIAADQLLIPVNPQFLSTAGLQPLLEMIHKVRLRFNPKIQISGILLTMCEQRTNLCKIISGQIRDAYSGTVPIFENSIPMNVKVGESVYYAQSDKTIVELPSSDEYSPCSLPGNHPISGAYTPPINGSITCPPCTCPARTQSTSHSSSPSLISQQTGVDSDSREPSARAF